MFFEVGSHIFEDGYKVGDKRCFKVRGVEFFVGEVLFKFLVGSVGDVSAIGGVTFDGEGGSQGEDDVFGEL